MSIKMTWFFTLVHLLTLKESKSMLVSGEASVGVLSAHDPTTQCNPPY